MLHCHDFSRSCNKATLGVGRKEDGGKEDGGKKQEGGRSKGRRRRKEGRGGRAGGGREVEGGKEGEEHLPQKSCICKQRFCSGNGESQWIVLSYVFLEGLVVIVMVFHHLQHSTLGTVSTSPLHSNTQLVSNALWIVNSHHINTRTIHSSMRKSPNSSLVMPRVGYSLVYDLNSFNSYTKQKHICTLTLQFPSPYISIITHQIEEQS